MIPNLSYRISTPLLLTIYSIYTSLKGIKTEQPKVYRAIYHTLPTGWQ